MRVLLNHYIGVKKLIKTNLVKSLRAEYMSCIERRNVTSKPYGPVARKGNI